MSIRILFDANQTIRVHFTDLVQYNAKISGTNGTGKFTYTAPIRVGRRSCSQQHIRSRFIGTAPVKLTLTPSANCVGTAEKSRTPEAAPKCRCFRNRKDGSFDRYPQRNRRSGDRTDTLFTELHIAAGKAKGNACSASAARAKAGDKVTLTRCTWLSAKKTLTLTPETALDKTVSRPTTAYTFTMPANDVAVTAAFAVKPSSGGSAGGRWARRRRCCTGSDHWRLVLHYRAGRPFKVPRNG